LVDVDIHGEIENVMINGVDIGPLVNAELDRRYPDPLDVPAELVGYLARRRLAKNARASATSRSGVSSAAKWPPASMSLQWTMLLLCSA